MSTGELEVGVGDERGVRASILEQLLVSSNCEDALKEEVVKPFVFLPLWLRGGWRLKSIYDVTSFINDLLEVALSKPSLMDGQVPTDLLMKPSTSQSANRSRPSSTTTTTTTSDSKSRLSPQGSPSLLCQRASLKKLSHKPLKAANEVEVPEQQISIEICLAPSTAQAIPVGSLSPAISVSNPPDFIVATAPSASTSTHSSPSAPSTFEEMKRVVVKPVIIKPIPPSDPKSSKVSSGRGGKSAASKVYEKK
jgi:hypothetical protein